VLQFPVGRLVQEIVENQVADILNQARSLLLGIQRVGIDADCDLELFDLSMGVFYRKAHPEAHDQDG
jgi:hypothetical protein